MYLAEERANVVLPFDDTQRAGVDARHVEQIADQPLHPRGRKLNGANEGACRGLVRGLGDTFCAQGDRTQRVAQVMGHHPQQVVLPPVFGLCFSKGISCLTQNAPGLTESGRSGVRALSFVRELVVCVLPTRLQLDA